MPDLHARLLAEIERRTSVTYSTPRNAVDRDSIVALMLANLVYLGALRKIVEIHTPKPVQGDESRIYCPTEDYDICAWPCPTIAAVAEALGVEP